LTAIGLVRGPDSGLCDQILADTAEIDTGSQESKVCEQGADELDGNLGACDTSGDDANTFNCQSFNSGSIEIMSRFYRTIICATTQTVMSGSRDEEGADNAYSPDYDHFNYCLAAEGFSSEDRHRIIEW
jgi:hypothetical protein